MTQSICRIVIVAGSLQRLRKVIFLLLEQEEELVKSPLASHEDDASSLVQYLPCVAQFDQYRHEETKDWIPYLVSVDYHPELITESSLPPTSLLELANAANDNDNPKITDICMGSGMDNCVILQHIQTYFQTLFDETIPLHCLEPSPPYTTMAEELQAYQSLSLQDKQVATQQQTMGPGKMVRFIRTVSQRRIQILRDEWEKQQRDEEKRQLQAEEEEKEKQRQQEEEEQEEHIIDPNKLRYACRICRTILFGQDDLIEHTTKQDCQSYFLHSSLPWMKPNNETNKDNNKDNDLRETLGRLTCQQCHAKLGTWNWSGTPCSCGAWVVPAFQFPKSKVDVIPPVSSTSTSQRFALPVGTVLPRPMARIQVQDQ